MSTVPVNRQAACWSANTLITISGVTMGAVGDAEFDWGYEVKREIVTGTNLPFYGTGAFKGTMKFDGIASSDNRWENAASITSGILQTFGMTFRETDTQGLTLSGAKTWTGSGKFTNFIWKMSKDNAVMLTLKGELVTEPTVVQS